MVLAGEKGFGRAGKATLPKRREKKGVILLR